ncbi:MAG: hypothetical protein HGA65_02825, partial [Oscillochloris sp.]|nr:hypothetical protein [Oscillochloris sp.]
MTRFYRLLLLALLALTPVSLVRASQQNPVTLDVHAGYDDRGQYHVGHWFPVQVVVANDGGDLSGTIEWRFAGESQPAFRSLIDLPRGARKQVLLPVISVNDDRTAVLQLVVNGQALAKSVVRLNPIASDTALVGVLSSDQTLLNSLSTTQLVSGFSTELSRMAADLFPTDPMLLAGLDVMVIHDIDLTILSDAQRAALASWVDLGGTLLVGGGPDA